MLQMTIITSFQYSVKQSLGHCSDDFFVPKGWIELGKNVPLEIAQRFLDDLEDGKITIQSTYQAMIVWHDYFFPYLIKGIK